MLEVVSTEDGSNTLFNKVLNESYHSSHGALTESKHIFIEAGFDYLQALQLKKPSVNLLEVGFGTGLNAILTVERSKQHELETTYTALEPFPLTQVIIDRLKYQDLLVADSQSYLLALHDSAWNRRVEIEPHFHLLKLQTSLADFQPSGELFDLVYYDAFAPNKQPEMWSLSILKKVYTLIAEGGFLVTYCANGQFKRDLKKCGFRVTSIPGPPGKREMTRAFKDLTA